MPIVANPSDNAMRPPSSRSQWDVNHESPVPSMHPHQREKPLLGNLTSLAAFGSSYMAMHVGAEAAAALLLAILFSMCALGYLVKAFCGYTLCCFTRGQHGRLKTSVDGLREPRMLHVNA